MSSPLLADLPAALTDHLIQVAGAVVVLVGLLVFGLADLARFSWRRVWAISGVCFAESVRRRVLWIIPLAILGLVAVVQLQQPSDEQDAIRQTTKFCLFASGLVVVLSTLILACTNLPREIENRVIFTVVTKPTTRLEIVLGKVVGFARVSFAILLVMGLFTWGYLHLRARLLSGDLEQRLARNEVEPISRPTFRHYVQAGLLNAKTLADPVTMNIYGRPPVAGSHRRYLNPEGYLLVPFVLPPDLFSYGGQDAKQFADKPGLVFQIKLGSDPARPAKPPATRPGGPPVPPPAPAGPPQVVVQVFDGNVNALMSPQQLNGMNVPLAPAGPDGRAGTTTVVAPLTATGPLARLPFVYVALSPGNTTGNGPALWVDDDPAVPAVQVQVLVADAGGNPTGMRTLTPADPAAPDRPGRLTFTGRDGTYGQQLKGDPAGGSADCVFEFRGTPIAASAAAADGTVPVELRVGIEKNGDTSSVDVPTDVAMTVTDPATGRSAAVPAVHPENNRTLYASIPLDLARTGDFDVSLRCVSPEQWVGLKPTSLAVVRADSSFGLNLAKSLTILWLLSVLVTSISVFCSTFLSWPTAVVFTVVLLFGRWGLNELGDAASAGLGRTFTSDFGVTNPASATALAGSVDLLNKVFKTVATVLPDVSAFSATDDIDRGVSIPARTLGDATGMLLGFGLPLTVLAYVIFKHKEVAP